MPDVLNLCVALSGPQPRAFPEMILGSTAASQAMACQQTEPWKQQWPLCPLARVLKKVNMELKANKHYAKIFF